MAYVCPELEVLQTGNTVTEGGGMIRESQLRGLRPPETLTEPVEPVGARGTGAISCRRRRYRRRPIVWLCARLCGWS